MTSFMQLVIHSHPKTGDADRDLCDLSVAHAPSPNDSDPLCYYAEGRHAKVGEMWWIAHGTQPVTCQDCLEWMHA